MTVTTKSIVFTVDYFGYEGRSPKTTVFASLDETTRDEWLSKAKNKNWYTTGERIVDLTVLADDTVQSMDGVARLALTLHFETLERVLVR